MWTACIPICSAFNEKGISASLYKRGLIEGSIECSLTFRKKPLEVLLCQYVKLSFQSLTRVLSQVGSKDDLSLVVHLDQTTSQEHFVGKPSEIAKLGFAWILPYHQEPFFRIALRSARNNEIVSSADLNLWDLMSEGSENNRKTSLRMVRQRRVTILRHCPSKFNTRSLL